MRERFLPFARPSVAEGDIERVADVLRSGWITSGPGVETFEDDFREYCGRRGDADTPGGAGAVALSSATAGFHLLFEALDIGPGDDVVFPSLTWPSPINMLVHRGATPVFADLEPGCLQIDPEHVERLVSRRTRAVVPVHFAGEACDIARLRELCEERGLLLIEDAAHAAGTEHASGERVGAAANPAVFSFHAAKNLTTAEGGMVTSGDAALLEKLRALRFHGVVRDEATRHYELVEPGWKYNMTDIQAALGSSQLERLDDMIAKRAELAARYDELLGGIDALERPRRSSDHGGRHAWHLYTVLVDRGRAGMDRDEFRERLRERNIGTGLHYRAVHELEYYRRAHPPAEPLPHTERVAGSIVSLPLFPDMTSDDVEDVARAIEEVLG